MKGLDLLVQLSASALLKCFQLRALGLSANDPNDHAQHDESDTQPFVWTLEDWQKKKDKVVASADQYFLIAKNPVDMAKILLDQPFDPGLKEIVVGPCNDRPGTVKLGNNQSITQEEAAAFEKLMAAGYNIEFALIKEAAIGNWKKFRGQFGYN